MNKHDVELPAEFRSGNDIPVTIATIKRERMEEILREAIEADRQMRDEVWKQAVDHELSVMHSTTDSYDTPAEAIRALIDWHVAVATDHPVFRQPAEPVEVPGDGVRCNWCGWSGIEDDLVIEIAADEPEEGPANVCPTCKRIGCLMDLGL